MTPAMPRQNSWVLTARQFLQRPHPDALIIVAGGAESGDSIDHSRLALGQ